MYWCFFCCIHSTTLPEWLRHSVTFIVEPRGGAGKTERMALTAGWKEAGICSHMLKAKKLGSRKEQQPFLNGKHINA